MRLKFICTWLKHKIKTDRKNDSKEAPSKKNGATEIIRRPVLFRYRVES